jgi:hypothetical protein
MTQQKRIAIVQSNYIPWKGYFDVIASVDEFILYDDVQFTKNDWRNRNKVKSAQGVEWLSIPVGQNIKRRICDVVLMQNDWQEKHWKTLSTNYGRAPFFREVAGVIEPLYRGNNKYTTLSEVNRTYIQAICNYLDIKTKISCSSDFDLVDGRIERLIDLCKQTRAGTYVSGPSAKKYLDHSQFASASIDLAWFDYEGYPEYPQMWGGFEHRVSILDLLFNCGRHAIRYMKFSMRESAL